MRDLCDYILGNVAPREQPLAITLCRVSAPVDEVPVAIPRGGTEGHTLKRTTPVMDIAEDSFPAMRSSDDGVEVADAINESGMESMARHPHAMTDEVG